MFLGTQEDGLPKEVGHVAAVITGKWVDHAWQQETKKVDFFVMKGIIEGLMETLGLTDQVTYVKATHDGLHPGRTADILLNGVTVGVVGQLHPTEQKKRDLKETYVTEMNLALLLAESAEALVYEQVPRYPSMSRDIALVVSKDEAAGSLMEIIQDAGGKLLKDVAVFDLYEGDKVEEGTKSIAFSLTYFDAERTLTDEEVVTRHDKVLAALKEKSGAVLRV